MIDFENRRYPHTGFGDNVNSSIKFMLIRYLNRDPEHSWSGGAATINTFQPRHTSNIVVQVPNEVDPDTMTVRLWFPDVASLQALKAVQGAFATLRYGWGITEDIGGEYEVIAGVPYLALPNTQLVSLTDRITPRGKQPEAMATFRRSVADASVAGFAIARETGE